MSKLTINLELVADRDLSDEDKRHMVEEFDNAIERTMQYFSMLIDGNLDGLFAQSGFIGFLPEDDNEKS